MRAKIDSTGIIFRIAASAHMYVGVESLPRYDMYSVFFMEAFDYSRKNINGYQSVSILPVG